ncbi:MAG TPA: CPBP family intramembrane glutamic endopeptidase [Polyangiaceae bacterium]|nr:CPBP family intramembrane glutamic endopeptidase [Polyangiaceae bacterium]
MLLELIQPATFPQGAPAPEVAAPLFGFATLLQSPYWKTFIPIPVIAALAPLAWILFRSWWRELDVEAHHYRGQMIASGGYDFRPAVMFVMVAIILTLQEYFGGRSTYDDVVRPWLIEQEVIKHHSAIKLAKYDELYGYMWWAFTRFAGYVLFPFPLYKLIFPSDSLLDMGLRVRGFFAHAWIYGALLLIVLPPVYVVSLSPDFGHYYPFYKSASRSWFDFLLWEGMYFAQFFGLELFFRGIWLGALRRSLGSGAIFAMCVPYCMIHFGKPYLEANGAIIAGIVLGTISMRTKSIYAGFLVHITVALAMDLLALSHRHALPHAFWAPG